MSRLNAYISIGNSDDRLSQARWAEFITEIRSFLDDNSDTLIRTMSHPGMRWQVHGEWYSRPDHPWQNANWCVEIDLQDQVYLLGKMYSYAKEFDQESIAVTFGEPRFVGPGGEDPR